MVRWHRKGFRLYWRWRSRSPGRPRVSTEIRDLIRSMSKANPLWGAPRIHGELLKFGIRISQATVGRCMPWRPKVPSPTWRSFLHNHVPDIAAIDMFVVATATFQLRALTSCRYSCGFRRTVTVTSESRPRGRPGRYRTANDSSHI